MISYPRGDYVAHAKYIKKEFETIQEDGSHGMIGCPVKRLSGKAYTEYDHNGKNCKGCLFNDIYCNRLSGGCGDEKIYEQAIKYLKIESFRELLQ